MQRRFPSADQLGGQKKGVQNDSFLGISFSCLLTQHYLFLSGGKAQFKPEDSPAGTHGGTATALSGRGSPGSPSCLAQY